eukprot:TRINITY_DN6093_c0_g1_i2.p2 TRINITY_DN6093_c0_g1~~TRINITY_DN6093_c0_g1_i2.p2  ORF type:complete len:149 (-),score=30.38 TRINITY_DN6093_c0_g1_i2:27-473(-)
MVLLLRLRDKKAIEALQLNEHLQHIVKDLESLVHQNTTTRDVNKADYEKLKELQREKDQRREQQKPNTQPKTLRGMLGAHTSETQYNEEQDRDTLQLEQDMSRKRVMNSLIREILQGLILESGVNWAKDEHLKHMMMTLNNTTSLSLA